MDVHIRVHSRRQSVAIWTWGQSQDPAWRKWLPSRASPRGSGQCCFYPNCTDPPHFQPCPLTCPGLPEPTNGLCLITAREGWRQALQTGAAEGSGPVSWPQQLVACQGLLVPGAALPCMLVKLGMSGPADPVVVPFSASPALGVDSHWGVRGLVLHRPPAPSITPARFAFPDHTCEL